MLKLIYVCNIYNNNNIYHAKSHIYIALFFGHNSIVEMLILHSHKMKKQRMNHGILDVNQCYSKGFSGGTQSNYIHY